MRAICLTTNQKDQASTPIANTYTEVNSKKGSKRGSAKFNSRMAALTMENLYRIRNTARELLNGKMEAATLATGRMTTYRALAFLHGQTVSATRETSHTVAVTAKAP